MKSFIHAFVRHTLACSVTMHLTRVINFTVPLPHSILYIAMSNLKCKPIVQTKLRRDLASKHAKYLIKKLDFFKEKEHQVRRFDRPST